ncbi:hypothetical protein FQN53_008398 [Emmonsiellopsis sp. PD_33]|nr:hypothetical protein FQN53_008398 [Emmonsiellopsis sp. PD_33]
MTRILAVLGPFLSFVIWANAHSNDPEYIARRDAQGVVASRALAFCAGESNFQDLMTQSVTRRLEKALDLKARRNSGNAEEAFAESAESPTLSARGLDELEAFQRIPHRMNLSDVDINTDPATLFATNVSCILTTETVVGPLYVAGEFIRQNLTEDQVGVPLHLEIQFINVKTCKPASGLGVDTWGANATGVYSGIITGGNGRGDKDPANAQRNFLRGVQITDDDGIVSFDTIFPGPYTNRPSHTHIMVHSNISRLDNGSYTPGQISHVGQLFYEDRLRRDLAKLHPYNTIRLPFVSNTADVFARGHSDNNYDPLVKYVYLGKNLSDGILAWISVGIDPDADHTADVALEAAKTLGAVPNPSKYPKLGSKNAGEGGSADYEKAVLVVALLVCFGTMAFI